MTEEKKRVMSARGHFLAYASTSHVQVILMRATFRSAVLFILLTPSSLLPPPPRDDLKQKCVVCL